MNCLSVLMLVHSNTSVSKCYNLLIWFCGFGTSKLSNWGRQWFWRLKDTKCCHFHNFQTHQCFYMWYILLVSLSCLVACCWTGNSLRYAAWDSSAWCLHAVSRSYNAIYSESLVKPRNAKQYSSLNAHVSRLSSLQILLLHIEVFSLLGMFG